MIGVWLALCILIAIFFAGAVGLYVFWVVILHDMGGDKNVETRSGRKQDNDGARG